MATSISRPASPSWTAVVTTRPSLAPPPAVIVCPVHADFAKGRVAQADHHAGNALVADQDVRAAAQHAHGELLHMAATDQRDQLLGRAGLGQVFRRAAHLEPGVHGQQFSPPHDLVETGQRRHG